MTQIFIVLSGYVGAHGDDYGIQHYLENCTIEDVYNNLNDAAKSIDLPDLSTLVETTGDSLGEGSFYFEKAWAHPLNFSANNLNFDPRGMRHYYIVEKSLREEFVEKQ